MASYPKTEGKTQMASASKKLPVLKIECSSCPNKVETNPFSSDGWDRMVDWICIAAEDKKIAGAVEWKDKVQTPHWCPLHKSTETPREHAFLVTLEQVFASKNSFPLSEKRTKLFSSESCALEALIEEYKKLAGRLDQKDKLSRLAILEDQTKISTITDFWTAVNRVGWFRFSIKETYINEGF